MQGCALHLLCDSPECVLLSWCITTQWNFSWASTSIVSALSLWFGIRPRTREDHIKWLAYSCMYIGYNVWYIPRPGLPSIVTSIEAAWNVDRHMCSQMEDLICQLRVCEHSFCRCGPCSEYRVDKHSECCITDVCVSHLWLPTFTCTCT